MGGGPYYAQMGGTRICDTDRVDQSLSDDNPVTGWSIGDDFIITICIHSGGKETEAAQYKLRWRNVTDEGSYADLGNSGELTYNSATVLVQGNEVTESERRCSTQGDSWQNGEEVEGASLCDSIDLADDYETEIHFGVNCDNALAAKKYAFELYDDTNGASKGNTEGGAEITMQAAVTPQAVGGGSVAMAGSLAKKGFVNAGGHSMTIGGTLVKKGFVNTGGHAMSIEGTLVKKGFVTAGGYSITITGDCSPIAVIGQAVGAGAVAIAGTLSTVFTQVVSVGGGAVAIAGTLVKKPIKLVGAGAVAIAGTLGTIFTAIKSVGQGSILPQGILNTQYIPAGGAAMLKKMLNWMGGFIRGR